MKRNNARPRARSPRGQRPRKTARRKAPKNRAAQQRAPPLPCANANAKAAGQTLSLIRTMTVGFGITPNLLTPALSNRALAGLCV